MTENMRLLLASVLIAGICGGSASCSNGWLLNDVNRQCYKFFNTEIGLGDVYQACRREGAQRITITTNQEQAFILDLSLAGSVKWDFVWLSLTDEKQEGDWVWSTGEKGTFTNWRTTDRNEPDGRRSQNCAIMDKEGMWHDIRCDGYGWKKPYICTKPEQTTEEKLEEARYEIVRLTTITNSQVGSLERKNEFIKYLYDKLKQKYKEFIKQDEALKKKDEELIKQDEALKQKDEALKQKDEALKQNDEALKQKDEALEKQEQALEKCTIDPYIAFLKDNNISNDFEGLSKQFSYEGHRYYLSKTPLQQDDASFHHICFFYYGYMLEIDNEGEFDAVKAFLNDNNVKDEVMVGGTYKEKDGIWKFTASYKTVTFFKWAPNFPKNEGRYRKKLDCIFLANDDNRQMYNDYCDEPSVKRQLICEIP